MEIIQFLNESLERKTGIAEGGRINELSNAKTTYDLFLYAGKHHISMSQAAAQLASGNYQDYNMLVEEKRILVPLDHPDPYHTWITGTGLTHLGSAASRNAMHEKISGPPGQEPTDSIKMFRMGMENGKMKDNIPAVQPEWFYKGNGLIAVHPGQVLASPSFASSGGEEPEIAGLYIIDAGGDAKRLGFALANEFSDHQMESINYLYLAHSKLRHCSYGPGLLLGDLPAHIIGESRIIRNNKVFWKREFLTGEDNMSHNIANLEYHHFKYPLFRQPGDVHIHFFGTSVLSFTDHIETKEGDVFEIEADCFGKSLSNELVIEKKSLQYH
ncbi:MAG TPA: AraD1 family protein [Chitinophagaceae bacterium]